MKPIAIQSNQPANFVKISYSPTDVCNYKCRYCFPGSNAGLYRWPQNYKQLVENFSHLFDFYKSNGKDRIELQILGGEPTLWPDLANFIKELKSRHDFVATVQTNGSRTLRWWQEQAGSFDRVNLTAHYKEIDLPHFTLVADTLYAIGVYVDVSVCMDPLAWDQCMSMIDYFKQHSKHRWYIGTQKIEEANGENLYTDEQLEFLSSSVKRYPNIFYAFAMRKNFNINRSKVTFDNGKTQTVKHNQVQINKWNNFYNWSCNVGVDMLYINPIGELSGSCGSSVYGISDKFNIYDSKFITDFKPELKPTRCKFLGCYCTPETLMTKVS